MFSTSAVTRTDRRSTRPSTSASFDPKWYSRPPLLTPASAATASSVAERSPWLIRMFSKASSTRSRAGSAAFMPQWYARTSLCSATTGRQPASNPSHLLLYRLDGILIVDHLNIQEIRHVHLHPPHLHD